MRGPDENWQKGLIIALIGMASGGAGYLGAGVSPVATDPQARPDSFTGTEGRAMGNDIEALERRMDKIELTVMTHNDDSWEWKQRIIGCEN